MPNAEVRSKIPEVKGEREAAARFVREIATALLNTKPHNEDQGQENPYAIFGHEVKTQNTWWKTKLTDEFLCIQTPRGLLHLIFHSESETVTK